MEGDLRLRNCYWASRRKGRDSASRGNYAVVCTKVFESQRMTQWGEEITSKGIEDELTTKTDQCAYQRKEDHLAERELGQL